MWFFSGLLPCCGQNRLNETDDENILRRARQQSAFLPVGYLRNLQTSTRKTTPTSSPRRHKGAAVGSPKKEHNTGEHVNRQCNNKDNGRKDLGGNTFPSEAPDNPSSTTSATSGDFLFCQQTSSHLGFATGILAESGMQYCQKTNGRAKRTAALNSGKLSPPCWSNDPSLVSEKVDLDQTFTPRSIGKIHAGASARSVNYTPREAKLLQKLNIPHTPGEDLPLPPGLKVGRGSIGNNSTTTFDAVTRAVDRYQILTSMFRDFVLEMNRGVYLTQMAASREYCQIHCSLSDDLKILTLDQNTGRLVEFPTSYIHQVFLRQIPTPMNQLRHLGSDPERPPAVIPKLDLSKLQNASDYIVVVEFARRKLIFVFTDYVQAERFRMCMWMLARKMNPDVSGAAIGEDSFFKTTPLITEREFPSPVRGGAPRDTEPVDVTCCKTCPAGDGSLPCSDICHITSKVKSPADVDLTDRLMNTMSDDIEKLVEMASGPLQDFATEALRDLASEAHSGGTHHAAHSGGDHVHYGGW